MYLEGVGKILKLNYVQRLYFNWRWKNCGNSKFIHLPASRLDGGKIATDSNRASTKNWRMKNFYFLVYWIAAGYNNALWCWLIIRFSFHGNRRSLRGSYDMSAEKSILIKRHWNEKRMSWPIKLELNRMKYSTFVNVVVSWKYLRHVALFTITADKKTIPMPYIWVITKISAASCETENN